MDNGDDAAGGNRADANNVLWPARTQCSRAACQNRPVERRSNGLAHQVAWLGAGIVSVGYALGALAIATGPGAGSTYAGLSTVSAALTALAGLGLIGTGVLLGITARFARQGHLGLLAGFLWFAPIWIGWDGGPPGL